MVSPILLEKELGKMNKTKEQLRERVAWEITTTQARIAKRRESIRTLIRNVKEDQQKLIELTNSVRR